MYAVGRYAVAPARSILNRRDEQRQIDNVSNADKRCLRLKLPRRCDEIKVFPSRVLRVLRCTEKPCGVRTPSRPFHKSANGSRASELTRVARIIPRKIIPPPPSLPPRPVNEHVARVATNRATDRPRVSRISAGREPPSRA